MTLPVYRSTDEYREILRLLQKASSEGENIVWQNHGDHRSVIPVAHFEIDFVAREVVLTLSKPTQALLSTIPLYVKLDYRSSVFKITDFKEGQGTLHFSFPQEIKTLELRQHPRKVFDLKREKTVGLRPSLGNQRDSANSLNVRVQDVSNYGLGLIISEQNRSFVRNNSILWITHLHKEELKYPVLAEVVHISSDGNRKNKEIKVGLKLSGLFSDEQYSNFIQ